MKEMRIFVAGAQTIKTDATYTPSLDDPYRQTSCVQPQKCGRANRESCSRAVREGLLALKVEIELQVGSGNDGAGLSAGEPGRDVFAEGDRGLMIIGKDSIGAGGKRFQPIDTVGVRDGLSKLTGGWEGRKRVHKRRSGHFPLMNYARYGPAIATKFTLMFVTYS